MTADVLPQRHLRSKAAEAVPLAQATHAAYARRVGQFKKHLSLPGPEAVALADKLATKDFAETINKPPDQTTWLDLSSLPPAVAMRWWEEIQKAALDELVSGHRVAQAHGTTPWERAQYLAVVEDLAQQWKPQGGVEWQLIETMALAQCQWLSWMTAQEMWASKGAGESGPDCMDESGRSTPRITESEAIERAAAMADRYNRMFLRTLRALCDLRRHAPTVIVQNAGQVNVGGQQVNMATSR